MKKVKFLFGLPCAGKTTWINNHASDHLIVSADKLKESHEDYDPENSHLLHEWSVKEAEKEFGDTLGTSNKIVFDGGGINNSYNLRLINLAKSHGYFVELIVLDTPAQVCLNRNELRERKIPREVIIDKAVKFNKCLHKLSKEVDAVAHYRYFENSHIFVDMDGTVAAYQHLPFDSYGCIDFINGEHFQHSEPVYPVINKLKKYYDRGSKIYVFSAIPDNLCEADKNVWLDTYLPFVKQDQRYFIGNKKYKYVMLRNLLKKMKLDAKLVTMLDDEHTVLSDLATIGINAIHTSMFLSDKY